MNAIRITTNKNVFVRTKFPKKNTRNKDYSEHITH